MARAGVNKLLCVILFGEGKSALLRNSLHTDSKQGWEIHSGPTLCVEVSEANDGASVTRIHHFKILANVVLPHIMKVM